MKRLMIFISLVSLLFLVGCESRIVGQSYVTGAVAGYDVQERMGSELVWIKEFYIDARNSLYTPNHLYVEEGDFVRLIIYASDKNYGFVLPGYDINEYLQEDHYVVIEFVADKPGTHSFFSNVYSGLGTKYMTGYLIVE